MLVLVPHDHVHALLVLERHEAEAARLARKFICHYHTVLNGSKLGEKLPELHDVDVRRQPTDEELPRLPIVFIFFAAGRLIKDVASSNIMLTYFR